MNWEVKLNNDMAYSIETYRERIEFIQAVYKNMVATGDIELLGLIPMEDAEDKDLFLFAMGKFILSSEEKKKIKDEVQLSEEDLDIPINLIKEGMEIVEYMMLERKAIISWKRGNLDQLYESLAGMRLNAVEMIMLLKRIGGRYSN